ncbi:MAG TPA: hypothetical protein DEB40_04330 [Elusimicrobia bacterium]|nr:hypothetical protein [Elusimicrobiota bacterium]HBT60951.1 hypothetical protein [Elusimicrobiota bacterium]
MAVRRFLVVGFFGGLMGAAGCAAGAKKIVQEDFAEGRVVDLSITDKLTGNRELLFVSLPKKSQFLEGYIQGVITDYADNPVQGVVVRAVASGESQIEESEMRSAGTVGSSFDPGVSDTNGFYRVRFSLPILSNRVDVRGRLLYNPGWEQERENLGKAYEPQTKQSQFRLYYERKRGRVIFSEGIRKSVVAAVTSGRPGKSAPLPGTKPSDAEKAVAPAAGAAAKPPDKGAEDDLFKGFGFGQ